jgi:manganese containing catalase
LSGFSHGEPGSMSIVALRRPGTSPAAPRPRLGTVVHAQVLGRSPGGDEALDHRHHLVGVAAALHAHEQGFPGVLVDVRQLQTPLVSGLVELEVQPQALRARAVDGPSLPAQDRMGDLPAPGGWAGAMARRLRRSLASASGTGRGARPLGGAVLAGDTTAPGQEGFGEMSTLVNDTFQSFNFRRKELGPFDDLVANIAAEEDGHIAVVGATLTGTDGRDAIAQGTPGHVLEAGRAFSRSPLPPPVR